MVVDFSTIIATPVVDLAGIALGAIVLALLVYRTLRWRKTAPSLFDYVVLVLYESRKLGFVQNLRVLLSVVFNDTATQRTSFPRFRSNFVHLSTFWGFVGLAATTTLSWILNPYVEPLELTHPVRILGNVSGVMIMIGLTVALLRRIIYGSVRTRTTEYDLFFFALIYAASVTGFAVEYGSMADLVALTHALYYLHIAAVALLILTAPFSKFVHALKLPILILFYRYRCALLERGILVPMMPVGALNQELLRAC